jgi:hypothetical protein
VIIFLYGLTAAFFFSNLLYFVFRRIFLVKCIVVKIAGKAKGAARRADPIRHAAATF